MGKKTHIDGWTYYNHAAIPTTPPHIDPDIRPIENGDVWRMEGAPLLARWTTSHDCASETNWWHVIKDTPFDISALKAKRRYEINKGKKNFVVKEIDASDHAEDLFRVTTAAYGGWDKKYRPTVEKDRFMQAVKTWNWYMVLGVFSVSEQTLCGYALLSKTEQCVNFNVLRVHPAYERLGANAAAVAAVLELHESFLSSGGYINDGSRSVNHETAFQDYLEKYFGFRKAYCHLHVRFRPDVRWVIACLYPLRTLLRKLDRIGKVHQLNALLKMREIADEPTVL